MATLTEANAKLSNSARYSGKVRNVIETEADNYLTEVKRLTEVGNNLGTEALKEVARQMGAHTNKYGRPMLGDFVGFAMAISGRNLSFNSRVQLAQVANGAVFHGFKPTFRTSIKVSETEGGLTYKLNTPAQFETDIG
jgi:hypothetical protein